MRRLSVQEAARMIGRSTFIVYNLIRRRILPTMPAKNPGKTNSRRMELRESDVRHYISRRQDRKARAINLLPVRADWITVGEAARLLKRGYHWVNRCVSTGDLVIRIDPQGHTWFRRKDIEHMQRRLNSLTRLPDLARLLGVSRQAVHKAVLEGRIPAQRIGYNWYVDMETVK